MSKEIIKVIDTSDTEAIEKAIVLLAEKYTELFEAQGVGREYIDSCLIGCITDR
jgi:hypothetical protein